MVNIIESGQGQSMKNSAGMPHIQTKHNGAYQSFEDLENCVRTRDQSNKIAKSSHCTCTSDKMCNGNEDCGYSCVRTIPGEDLVQIDKFQRYQHDLIRNPFRNVVSDISTCIQKTFDNIHMSRIMRVDGTLGECYKSWQTSSATRNSISGSSNEKNLNICRKAWNFSGEQGEEPAAKKSRGITNAENNSNFKPVLNIVPCIHCCHCCRGREIFQKTGSCSNSLNNQVEKTPDSSELHESMPSGSTKIENRPPVLPMGRNSELHKEIPKPAQINNRNSLGKESDSQESKSSAAVRSTQGNSIVLGGPRVSGASKNTESRRESAVDSYLSTSPEQSDSSVIRAMEDEDATSEDIRNGGKKRQVSSTEKITKKIEAGSMEDDTKKVDSESVTEFNSLIRNNTVSSPHESSSSVQDLGTVFSDDNWHEYKRRSMASHARFSRPSVTATDDRSRASYLSRERLSRSNNTVILKIESLSLDHKSSLLEDPEIHQLYIEFSFLGHHGVDLETISVPKPAANENAYFNYTRKFEIDGDEHQMQRSIMRAMMTDDDNPTVKFTVVSEPLPNDMKTKECIDVGYAYLNIRDHVLSGSSNEVELTIVNVKQTEPIGFLNIILLGVEAIRRCMSDLV